MKPIGAGVLEEAPIRRPRARPLTTTLLSVHRIEIQDTFGGGTVEGPDRTVSRQKTWSHQPNKSDNPFGPRKCGHNGVSDDFSDSALECSGRPFETFLVGRACEKKTVHHLKGSE